MRITVIMVLFSVIIFYACKNGKTSIENNTSDTLSEPKEKIELNDSLKTEIEKDQDSIAPVTLDL